MNMQYIPREELYHRIKRFQELLLNNDVDGALIIQKADLFYFSGTCQNAHLFIPAQGEPVLMVRKSLKRAREESALDNINDLRGLDELFKTIAARLNGRGKVGLEMDVLPANLFLKYKKHLFPLEVVDISKFIRETRIIKSPYEIDRLKDSAKLNFEMFSGVSDILREGMTEVELAGKLESLYREKGHQGAIRMRGFNQEIFYGHLMSGWNLSYPSFFDGPTGGTGLNPSYPQSAGFKKIGGNEPIMVDYVGVYNGYMVDQARIFCIGELSGKLVGAYEAALKIKAQIVKNALPGANGKDLYEIAGNIAAESGYRQYFMGFEDRVSFIGHGVGIELDELPVIAKNFNIILQPGMVFALEPKFIFPDEGAVGIEDTFVVTESGLEQITYFDEAIQYQGGR
ncbi:M24 family metallopeptidase [Desulfoscipio gibsoniae]